LVCRKFLSPGCAPKKKILFSCSDYGRGFAEEVKDTKAHANEKLVRYLPHRAVIRDDKITTKCRIVFDASAREEDSVSLNDCVLPGPALLPNLVSVLIVTLSYS
jgi:hypothetical protein